MWDARQIANYLEDWGIVVVQSADKFSLSRPEGMPREQFEFVAEVAKSHLSTSAVRAEFLKLYTGWFGDGWTPRYRDLPPQRRREADFRRLRGRADIIRECYGWDSRAVLYSSYDRSTSYLPADADSFPGDSTAMNLVVAVPGDLAASAAVFGITDRFGTVVIAGREMGGERRWMAFDPGRWYPLPGSRPPPGWRDYPGWVQPPRWFPPKGWIEPAKRPSAIRDARRKWFRENWGSEKSQQLPD